MNPFSLSDEEISVWTTNTQALAKLADAHFDTFNRMERAKGKRERNKLQKALGTLWRAAEHVRTLPTLPR